MYLNPRTLTEKLVKNLRPHDFLGESGMIYVIRMSYSGPTHGNGKWHVYLNTGESLYLAGNSMITVSVGEND
jgi:hypothetical protein